MVHPYLRRRQGKVLVTYPSAGIAKILGPTLGVPLFQEQVMALVIHAGYTPEEADGLRPSMAATRPGGDIKPHRKRHSTPILKQDHPPQFHQHNPARTPS